MNKLSAAALALMLGSCAQNKEYAMGSYGYDVAFFEKNNIETIELTNDQGARVLLAPGYQGRVMTSTAEGLEGGSFGWINYKLIESGEVSPQFNPVGGEERFWLGPEGGEFSYYFKPGARQVHANWLVPKVIDTEAYDVSGQNPIRAVFTKQTSLVNASGTEFKIGIERVVSLLDKAAVAACLGTEIPAALKYVAFCTDNRITNIGAQAWTRQTGLPSIWLLGLFNPSPTTTVFMPYCEQAEGRIVNDEYFGKVPADRLICGQGMLYFKIDGKYRSKIGLPAGRAKEICGSYDSEKKVLTLVKFIRPEGPADYVNGQWGEQADPFNGDVINAYNDGPLEDGSVMGPFYEIESSSPGAALAPGQTLSHIQTTIHIQGDETGIAGIVKQLFGVELEAISKRF